MTLLQLFEHSFIIGFSGAAAPGPLMAVIVSAVPRAGIRAALLITLAHVLLELVLVMLLFHGVALVIQSYPGVTRVIAILGGAVLLWMASGMIRDVRKATGRRVMAVDAAVDNTPQHTRSLLYSGVGATIGNPYWFVWWTTVGAALVLAAQAKGMPGVGAVYLGHIGADFTWNIIVALVLWCGRGFFATRGYHVLMTICAIALFYFAGFFIYSGIFGHV